MFYGSEKGITLMSGSAYRRYTTLSREQEGQLIETEATGAPQKHHHTLNQ
jgi:hypothetical protein